LDAWRDVAAVVAQELAQQVLLKAKGQRLDERHDRMLAACTRRFYDLPIQLCTCFSFVYMDACVHVCLYTYKK